MKYRVADVFVPGGLPKHTYVPRGDRQLETQIVAAKDNLCKIVTVTGATKSGKTVLARKVFPQESCVWLDGGAVRGVDAFWDLVSGQLQLVVEDTRAISKESGGEIGGEFSGQASIVVVRGSGKVATKRTTNRATTIASKVIKSHRGEALRVLKAQRIPIVIDDFHYIAREAQGQITRILKPLVFEGVPVIYLVIPHRRFDAVKVEREMNGRVSIVQVPPWEHNELREIAQLGFPLLNVRPEPSVSDRLAAEAQGSPHLMQEFCKNTCLRSKLTETSDDPLRIVAQFPFEEVFREVAQDLGRNIFDRLARGPRTRTDRKARRLKDGREADIYKVVLIALADLHPGVATVEYEPLRAAIRGLLNDALPQAHEVSRVLEQMAKISSTDESSVPVIDYEKDERKLHITDPFFAFFLKWGRQFIDG
jgi:chloramphenicol 3-O-phosphotransferase